MDRLPRYDLLNLRETSQFRAACEWLGPAPTGLGPILISAQTGAKTKPASNTWSCPPTGVDASAALAEGMILPDADSGPTLGTQPPPAELSGQVGELAGEL